MPLLKVNPWRELMQASFDYMKRNYQNVSLGTYFNRIGHLQIHLLLSHLFHQSHSHQSLLLQ